MSTSAANHRFTIPPTGCVHLDALWCGWTVYEMAGPVLPDGFDVAASLMPAVAAEAISERKGVAASVADCCGSGIPTGQDVAASSVPSVVAAASFWDFGSLFSP